MPRLSRKTVVARIAEGIQPTVDVLDRLNISEDEMNDIRQAAGLSPLIRPGGHLTADKLLKMIEQLAGKPQLQKDGKTPKTTLNGELRILSTQTVRNYAAHIRRIIREIGCENDLTCFKDAERVIESVGMRGDSAPTSYNTQAAVMCAIKSITKYIPDFKAIVGDDALRIYTEELERLNRILVADRIERTERESESVPDISDLRDAVKSIEKKFGSASREYLAAYLHTQLPGLRDDLIGIRIHPDRESARSAPPEENLYIRGNGEIHIRSFKTRYLYPPYLFRLTKAQKDVVERSIQDNPRDTLLGNTTNSRVIRKAFRAVGFIDKVTPMVIRHSMETDMLGDNPSAKNINRVAKLFRHSPEEATMYIRPVHTQENNPRRF